MSDTVTSVTVDVATLARSFERHLRASNRSPRTIETYRAAVDQLDAFLAARGMPRAVASIRGEHVGALCEDLPRRWKPATASNRFRALQSFFKFLVDEGEVSETPMGRMKPPTVPETPVPVLSLEKVTALLNTCPGRDL